MPILESRSSAERIDTAAGPDHSPELRQELTLVKGERDVLKSDFAALEDEVKESAHREATMAQALSKLQEMTAGDATDPLNPN